MKKRTRRRGVAIFISVLVMAGLVFSFIPTASAAVTKAAFANYAYNKVGAAKSTFAPDIQIDDIWCTLFVKYCAKYSGFKTSESDLNGLTDYSRSKHVLNDSTRPVKGDTAYINVNGAGHWGVIYSCTSTTMKVIEANTTYNGGNNYTPPQVVTYVWKPATMYYPARYYRDDGQFIYVAMYCKN